MITGKEIWRNKIHFRHENGWICELIVFYLYSLIIILGIIAILDYFLINRWMLILTLIISSIVVSIFSLLIVLRYFKNFIIIYEKGVLLRKSQIILCLKKRFVPWEQVTNADYIKVKKVRSRFWGYDIDLFLSKEERTERYIKLRIFLKDKKPFIIDSKLVSNYRKCVNLVLKYKKG